jgi:hypothetical protein
MDVLITRTYTGFLCTNFYLVDCLHEPDYTTVISKENTRKNFFLYFYSYFLKENSNEMM